MHLHRTFGGRRLLPCLFILATAAQAQRYEVGVDGGMIRISTRAIGSLSDTGGKDTDVHLSGGYGAGARFTWNTKGYYGHEFSFMQSRSTVHAVMRDNGVVTREGTANNRAYGYNFMMYFMPAGEKWRPYFTAGAHMTQYGEPKIENWTRGTSRNYGGNYGGGLKLMPVQHFIIRIDVRDAMGGSPYNLKFEQDTKFGSRIRQLEATVGLSIGF